jgi:hypothetical protein
VTAASPSDVAARVSLPGQRGVVIGTVVVLWFWTAIVMLTVLVIISVIVWVIRSADYDLIRREPVVPDPDLIRRVRRLLYDGHRHDAIQLYRSATGLPLPEARTAVENIGMGKPSASGSSDLAENARNIRNSRGMAAATNFVREQTGMNYGEAQAFLRALE